MLPFVKFVNKGEGKENDIENSVLSLLLELPMDSHFVDLFAHCFPLAAEESLEEKSDKWKSLMSRVKLKLDLYNAKHDGVKSPAEVYVEKSKARLEQLHSATFQVSPFEKTVSQMTSGSSSALELTANALYVGSWEFEYDIVYIEFLDTLISILSPIEDTVTKLNYSVTSLSKDHVPSYRPPLIAAYYSQRFHSKSFKSDNAAWNSVINFIEQIHHWAHLSSTLPSTPSELPSMRVSVYLKFLINCLQLYSRPTGNNEQYGVEHHMSNSTVEVTLSDGDGSRISPVDVPDFHEDNSPVSEDNSSSAVSSQTADSQVLLVEDLTTKVDSKSVEIMDHSKESAIKSKLLLKLPQGTLQVYITFCVCAFVCIEYHT